MCFALFPEPFVAQLSHPPRGIAQDTYVWLSPCSSSILAPGLDPSGSTSIVSHLHSSLSSQWLPEKVPSDPWGCIGNAGGMAE
jgi:hypothetical protein